MIKVARIILEVVGDTPTTADHWDAADRILGEWRSSGIDQIQYWIFWEDGAKLRGDVGIKENTQNLGKIVKDRIEDLQGPNMRWVPASVRNSAARIADGNYHLDGARLKKSKKKEEGTA